MFSADHLFAYVTCTLSKAKWMMLICVYL